MNMRKNLCLSVMMFVLPATLLAAITDMKFRRLDTRDGLSNSQVLCVHRDTKGFVWIGTSYGLNRYDGYRVKSFYSEIRDTTTLRSDYVGEIFEDADGKLWLRQSMSYCIFDPVTEHCDRHPERWLEEHGVTGGLEYLFVDSKKEFWVKTYNDGFFHLNPTNGHVKKFPFGYDEQEFVQEIGVSGMAEFGNLVALASNKGEVITFDRERDVIISKDSYLPRNGLTHDQDCKPRYDREGNLWIITSAGSFVRDAKTGKWAHSVISYLQSLGINNVPEELSLWDMLADDKQCIWLATDHGGLYVIDLKGKEMKQFLNNKYDESSLSDNTLRNLYQDQLGRMWIGSYMNGLNLTVSSASMFRNKEMGVINTICYDKRGYTWLGTNDKGIIRFDSRTDEVVVYNKENSGIGSNTMVGSLAASDGSVWFGTYEGGLIHIKNGQFTNYRATGDTLGLANNNVWTVYEDQWGNIWIGTLGGGVQRIDKKTGRFTTLNTRNSKLPSDYISTITRTKKGWLMVSHSKYYSLINPKTLRIVNRELTDQHKDMGVIEMSITAMEDSRGLAWQGTTSGASVWNPKTGEVYMLNIRSGLYGNTVNGIIEDDQHTMWLVTDYGISNVVVQQQDNGRYHFLVRSFNNRDGLQIGPYNQRSICDTKTGVILVGGQGGLDILNPKSMSENRVKEIPLFSGLQVADRDVVVGEEINGRVILEKALNECRKLSLSYKDQFTVQLASNSGEIHNPSRFVYMLEGVNEDWVKTSEVNPNISFMSLRYGDYTLRVRMLNDDGTIGEDEISLDIHVAAPFWRARWAMLFYVLAVLAAVWLWRRYFLRRQKERMELEQQLREMEKIQWMNDMRAQLMKEGVTLKQAPETPQEKLFYQPVVDELVNFARTAVEGYKMPEEKACKLSFSTSLNRLTMRFDPVLLTRLFEILISNATKFSPRGSRIKVSLAKVDNMAEIRVADRGLGIPDDARSHLFDEHAGIGLDVVKRIVDMHGGTARAEDNPDGGTIFVISLPADIKPEDDAPIEYAVQMDD